MVFLGPVDLTPILFLFKGLLLLIGVLDPLFPFPVKVLFDGLLVGLDVKGSSSEMSFGYFWSYD